MPCLARISPSTSGFALEHLGRQLGELEARDHVGHEPHGAVRTPRAPAPRRRAGRPGSAPRRRACGRRTCAAGRRAAASRPTGWARPRRAGSARWALTMSSSESASSARSRRSGASFTAGSPAGSMAPMSQPEPLTHSTSCRSPSRSVIMRLDRGVAAAVQHQQRVAAQQPRGVDAQRHVLADALRRSRPRSGVPRPRSSGSALRVPSWGSDPQGLTPFQALLHSTE